MTVTYEFIGVQDAIDRDLPDSKQFAGDYVDEWQNTLYRCVDGDPVEFIADDYGEPEDQSFMRNFGWVAGALQEAYRLGVQDGQGS